MTTRSATTRVFVYGTLLRGEANHRILACSELVGPAATPPVFTLVDLGAYPALLTGGRHVVRGEVYAVSVATLAALDRLEGHPTHYTRTRVSLAGGTTADAYLMSASAARAYPQITSGDWRAHRRSTRPEDRG